MISGWMIALPQDGVIEQIGERSDRTIETAVAARPPIRALEYQVDVLTARLVNPRILEDKPLVVERETGAEGVRERQQSDHTQCHRCQEMAPVWPGGTDGFAALPPLALFSRFHGTSPG